MSRMRSSEVSFGPKVMLALGQLGLGAKVVGGTSHEPISMFSVPSPTTVESDENVAVLVTWADASWVTLT